MTHGAVQDERARAFAGMALVAGLLFAYTALRAALLPITWDEAYNYLEFTRKGELLPFSKFRGMAANNHYLSSWLTYLTTAALGVSELTLRLPVLAAHVLFLYYTALLCRRLASPLLRLSAFVVLNANPYVLDFFSLSRGYGLAYGLMAGSLWHLYRFFHEDPGARDARASIGFAIAAVAAHLTLIHLLLALAAVIVLATIVRAPGGGRLRERVRYALGTHGPALAAVGLLLVPMAYVILKLRRARAFFYGGTTGFWHDTVIGVLDASLYERDYPALLGAWLGTPLPPLSHALGGLLTLLLAAAVWVSVRALLRGAPCRELYLPTLVFLVSACITATVAQHHLLEVRYLKSRTGLYLLLLAGFILVFLADALARAGSRWWYLLPATAALAATHLLNCLNLSYALEWKVGADVKHVLADIAAARDTTRQPGRTTALGINLEFEAPLNFYRLVDGLDWLNVADRRMKFHPLSDFYLYTEGDWRTIDPDSLVVLKAYPLSGARLLRRTLTPSRYVVAVDRTLDVDAPAVTGRGHPRSGGIEHLIELPRDAPDSSLILVTAMIRMENLRNATAQLVVRVNRGQPAYSWQTMPVRDAAPEARTWFPVAFTAFVPRGVRPGDRVSVYLENRGDPVSIDDLRMRLIRAVATPSDPVSSDSRR